MIEIVERLHKNLQFLWLSHYCYFYRLTGVTDYAYAVPRGRRRGTAPTICHLVHCLTA